MTISWFGIILGALLWGIVLSGWVIVRRKSAPPLPDIEDLIRARDEKIGKISLDKVDDSQ